jgi:hypothetical protein
MHPALRTIYYSSGSSQAPAEPTVQASSLWFSNVTSTSLTVNLTRGNGDGVILLAKANSTISTFPSDNTEYTDNGAYGSGDEIDGAYVVGKGTGTSYNVTNLTPGDTYEFRAFEFNV